MTDFTYAVDADGVATITFDSPSKRNALEPAMRDELAVALQHIQQDKSIRAVVLTGAGGHFCSGGDLKNIAAANLDNGGWLGRMQTLHEWVKKAEVDAGGRAGVPTEVAAKLKALERENRELRQANEILRKASAYFAMAELDRPFKR